MIIGGFTGLLGAGGIERINRHNAAILAMWGNERGLECHFFSINDPAGVHTVNVGDVSVTFRGFGRNRIGFVLALLFAYRKGTIVLLGHPNMSPIGLALRVVDNACTYWILTYGIDVWQPLSWIRRRGLAQSRAVLSLSGYTTEQVVEVQGVPASIVVTIAPALDPEFAEKAEAKQENAISERPFTLLTVARLTALDRYKGIEKVIEAMSLLEEKIAVNYVIVGEGDDVPYLRKRAEDFGVASLVNFVGAKFGRELKKYYRDCDIFVMPSKKEGFGIVFLEAMANGKACIGGNHGGTPDVIVDGETGFLVDYEDVITLRDRIHTLFTDKILRDKMGEQGRKRVQNNFTFEKYRLRLLAILFDL